MRPVALLIAAAAVSCGDTERSAAPRARTDARPSPDDEPPPQSRILVAFPTCLERGGDGEVTIGSTTVSYCQEHVCAEWDRATKVVEIESIVSVDARPDRLSAFITADARDRPDEITVTDDGRVEVCAPHRSCFELRPVEAHAIEIRWALLNDDNTLVAVVLSGDGGKDARAELWSVATGRKRVDIAIAGLDPDIDYDLDAQFVPGGLIVYAIDGEDDYATATLYGLDGRRRAVLGDGSELLDADEAFMLDHRRLAMFDWGGAGEPYRLLVHDVRTGDVLARYPIPPIAEDNSFAIDRTDAGIVATSQWSTELRVDVIDAVAAKAKHDIYVAPGCAP